MNALIKSRFQWHGHQALTFNQVFFIQTLGGIIFVPMMNSGLPPMTTSETFWYIGILSSPPSKAPALSIGGI